MDLRRGDYRLWMSRQHYSGYGRERYERDHNLPSRWPGQRPRYVAAEIATLAAQRSDMAICTGATSLSVT
jgi:hypothetical protein